MATDRIYSLLHDLLLESGVTGQIIPNEIGQCQILLNTTIPYPIAKAKIGGLVDECLNRKFSEIA